MSEFEGKVVVVTGGASGIGKATALVFAQENAKVAVLDWKVDVGEKTQVELRRHSPESCFLRVDVKDSRQVQDAVSQIMSRWGRIDVLFANAAVQVNKRAADITEEEWDRMHDVNLKGVFLCCKYVIPVMQKQRNGAIIITGSGQSLVTSRTFACYAATKAGLLAFMKGVALDYAEDGIRANCILPGSTESGLMDEYLKRFPDGETERQCLINSIPLRRLGTPEDMAKAVRFLASSDASYVTGSSLLVDGGILA
jgi:meso-butanediol dehydrogenase/(S,S)-butanediol dehydrogenase/diacetyl reductase